jgi:hypothetical protein
MSTDEMRGEMVEYADQSGKYPALVVNGGEGEAADLVVFGMPGSTASSKEGGGVALVTKVKASTFIADVRHTTMKGRALYPFWDRRR